MGFQEDEILLCSGKTGIGVKELIEEIIKRVPAPSIQNQEPLRALIFDSYFDPYKGVVALIKVVDGSVKCGNTIKMMASGSEFLVTELGVHHPKEEKVRIKLGECQEGFGYAQGISMVSWCFYVWKKG